MNPKRALVRIFDRAVLAATRRLSRKSRTKEIEELTAESPLPDVPRPTALSWPKKVAAGFIVVAVASTGGLLFGYEQGQDAAEAELGAEAVAAPVDHGGLVGLAEDVCRGRAEVARAEFVRDGAGEDPDGGLSSMLIGMSELEECRAELELESAELKAQEVRDQFGD